MIYVVIILATIWLTFCLTVVNHNIKEVVKNQMTLERKINKNGERIDNIQGKD